MKRAVKKLFKFDYQSPLNIKTCKERLSSEYREKLKEEGLYRENIWFGWITYINNNRKGEIIIDCRSILTFTYRFALEEGDRGTILHCKHNPLSPFALLFPLLFTTIPLVGVISTITNALFTKEPFAFSMFLGFFLFFLFCFLVCLFVEYSTRNKVNNLVRILVEAEMIK